MPADGTAWTAASTTWTNWSANLACAPAAMLQPADEKELREAVLGKPGPVRLVGAGHSFTSLATTDGTLINLDCLNFDHETPISGSSAHRVNRENSTAWVNAGARLRNLSPDLEAHGLAFRNLGDINVQSLAGAAGTATHGAGAQFRCLAGEIIGVRMMAADGEIIEAGPTDNPDLLRAAQVSLGALGVLLEAEVRLQPSYNLHRRTWAERLPTVLAEAHKRWATHRNYEFFVLPHSGFALNLTHDETGDAATPRPPSEDEAALASLRKVRSLLGWSPWLRRQALSTAIGGFKEENVVGYSWRLLSSVRETRFNEMEYHLPVETALDALQEVVALIEQRQRDVYFPIEVRMTAGDDAWLSPFQGAPRISIAVHADASDPHHWFFTLAEPVFRRAGGRPHWGKMHSLSAHELVELYPDFDRFRALRREMDPKGRFLNEHLCELFGESRAA